MDADIGEAEVTVKIQRHASDMHSLAEDVGQRIVTILKQHPTGCFFFNPAITISCLQPTEEFFRAIRKEQARWCRQAGNTFPRKIRRSSSKWVSGGEWISNKFARYLDRALCFMGILFHNGKFIPTHEWPKSGRSPGTSGTPSITHCAASQLYHCTTFDSVQQECELKG